MKMHIKYKQLLIHTIRYAVGGGIRAVGALGFTFIFTRMFLPAQFGYYSLARSLIVFSTLILTEWIKQAINRYLPGAKTKKEVEISKNTIVLYTYLLTLLFLVIIIILGLLNINIEFQYINLIFSSLLMIWIFSIYNICLQTLSSEIQSGRHTVAKIMKSAGRLIFPLLLIYLLTKKIKFLILGETVGLGLVIPYMWKRANLKLSFNQLFQHFSLFTKYL